MRIRHAQVREKAHSTVHQLRHICAHPPHTNEDAQRHRDLYKRHERARTQAHTRVLVHLPHLQRLLLQGQLVAAFADFFHFGLVGEDFRLQREELGGVLEAPDGDGDHEEAPEERASDDGVEPREAGGYVNEFHRPLNESGGGPASESHRSQVTILESSGDNLLLDQGKGGLGDGIVHDATCRSLRRV